MASAALTFATTVKLNSGEDIPVLGFGVGMSRDAFDACSIAFQVGYRHIDSARLYRNEADVGLAVEASGLPRNFWFLTTKIGSKDHGYQQCKMAIEDSTQDPKPKYWDLILLHEPMSGPHKRIMAYKALVEAQKVGKTKSIGVSNFGLNHLIELEKANVGPSPSINQLEIHPWCQQRQIVEYCRSKGIVIQAYCPIVRGKYMKHSTLVAISEKHKKTPAQVLIRWSLQSGFIPLPKSDTPQRILENSQVFDFQLDFDDMLNLYKLDKGDKGAISWNPTHCP